MRIAEAPLQGQQDRSATDQEQNKLPLRSDREKNVYRHQRQPTGSEGRGGLFPSRCIKIERQCSTEFCAEEPWNQIRRQAAYAGLGRSSNLSSFLSCTILSGLKNSTFAHLEHFGFGIRREPLADEDC